jgi:cellobiose-specific phosphotransferase system component IIA
MESLMFKTIKTAEQKAAEAAQQKLEQAEASRKAAYAAEADPLFFKAQRGEVEQQVWLDKIAEIKQRFPK